MRLETREHAQGGHGRRGSWGIAAGAAAALGLLIGCGGGGSSSGNDAGTGTGGATGSGGTTSGSGGTTSGTGGNGGGVIATANLGKACTSAATCGTGLTCLLATDNAIFGQGGPAHGYCTIACTTQGDADTCTAGGGTCENLGPDSNTPQIFCLQNCTRGKAGALGKCQNRPDVACTSLPPATAGGVGATVCIPTCSQDLDCPNGRVCDETASVCVDMQSAGTPTGTHCTFDPTGNTDTCAGVCLPLGSAGVVAASFCTRRCSFLELNACNYVGMGMSLASGGPHSVCGLATTGAALGDQGYCVQLCDSPGDCTDQTDPGLACDLTPQAQIGHGVCSWGAPAGDGGTDTAPGDGGTG